MNCKTQQTAPLALLCALTAFALASPGHAAVTGVVKDQKGQPVPGAMVTLNDHATMIETTVFTGSNGQYTVDPAGGDYTMSARLQGYAPQTREVKVFAGQDQTQNVTLGQTDLVLTDIPSDQWLGMLPEGDMKREFIVNCATCHEMASTRTLVEGKTRTKEQWAQAIEMMRAIDNYKNIPIDFVDDTYAAWLAANITDAKVKKLVAPPVIDPELASRVEITEYPVPEADELPHDLAVGPDGKIWITAFWHSELWALDPATGAYTRYPCNPSTDNTATQIRALKFDKKGWIWAVLGGTQSLIHFDPATGKYKNYPVGMYAHDVELDSNGDPWLNDYFSKPERIGHLNPVTGELKEIKVPSANLTEAQGLPLPYGMKVDAKNRVWGSQLTANTLFRYDIATGAAKLFQMPEENSGPRRMTLGKDGMVWIPEWNTGYLTQFDPDLEKFTRYKIGPSAAGTYAAELDPVNGAIWVTGSLANTLIRFDPATKSVQTFPLPTEPAMMRHIAVDPNNGDVWSAYSSLPTASAKIVRLRVRN